MRAAGIKARIVPYKGGGEVLSATVGGHVDFPWQFLPSTIPLVRGNTLRALAVQSDRRPKAMPEIPTVRELGFDALWSQRTGITTPKRTLTTSLWSEPSTKKGAAL
jgi:putative tricarboxylic transport membrane protein